MSIHRRFKDQADPPYQIGGWKHELPGSHEDYDALATSTARANKPARGRGGRRMADVPGALEGTERGHRPPRDNLVRAMSAGVAVRDAAIDVTRDDQPEASANENGMPTMYGHFGVFNKWAEINSWSEGNFMERVAPGAYKKTFREITPKVLFQHGADPQVGDKVMGAPDVLREDPEDGPYAEVPLLDTSYNRDLVPGLEAGLYGASFRFSVMREEWIEDPGVSDDNPKGLPERTIKELRCAEFGPCTFPAYADASMGVRSMTDEYLIARATTRPDSLRAILDYLEKRDARPDLHTSAPTEQEGTDITQDERDEALENEAAAAVIEEAEAGAPVASTPLIGSRKAAPGTRPTPLYTGKQNPMAAPGEPTPLYIGTDTRKEWEL